MAGLGVQLVDAAPPQFLQQGGKIDLALGVGQQNNLGPGGAQGGGTFRRLDRGGDQHPAPGQDLRRRRRLQAAVDDHPQRLARGGDVAHGQARIVVAHRADAGQDGAGAGPPAVAVAACVGAGDPLAAAVVQGRLAIQAGRHLQAQPGTTAGHARDETDIQFARLVLQQTACRFDAGRPQQGEATAGNQRIGVFHGRDDAADAGSNQRFRAGRRAPVVAAGFERDVGGGTARPLAGGAQGMDFGMRLAGLFVPAFADDLAVTDQHAADARIGRGRP